MLRYNTSRDTFSFFASKLEVMSMNSRRCIRAILFLATLTSAVSTAPNDDNAHCNEDVTNGFDTDFIWPATNSSGFYTSQPQCFDDNATLITRECANNTWHPETIAYCTEINKVTNTKSPINTTDTVEAFLTFDRRRRDMYLMVYHPDNVKKVTCHTFGKKSIGVKLIFDSRIFNWGHSSYTVHKLDLEDLPNVYWCKILQRDWKAVQTEDVVGFGENYSNEFAVRVTVRPGTGGYEELLKSSSKVFEDVCDDLEVDCRLMEVFKVDVKRRKTELLYHLTSNRRKQVISEFYEFTNRIKYYHPSVISLEYLRSSDYCLPDKTMELYFSLTPLGAYTRPSRLCLHENGTLVTRRCAGSFLYGAEWVKFNDRCSENAYVSEFTQYIYDVLTNFTLTVDSFRNITNSFQTLQNVSTLDISLLSDSLYESSNLAIPGIESDFIASVNGLFKIDKGVLKNSQVVLNSTDRILDSIEMFLDKKSAETNETHPSLLVQEENLVVFITKPVLSNLSGILLYGNYSASFLDYSIIEVSINETIEDFEDEDGLELAVHVPANLFNTLTNNLTLGEKYNLSLIITLYNNDSIFNEDNATSLSNSRIISVTIPGLGSYLEIPIPLIFRPNLKTYKGKPGCGFWYYGQTKKGKWSTTGGDYTRTNNTIRCSYNHLTHFALLILTARTTTSDTEGVYVVVDGHLAYTLPLSIITVTGCTISLIGVLGIFITAIRFRRFREKLGTKILIQLSITIILEIILTQLAGLDNWLTKPNVCTTVGILLHYVVLSKFCWMFVIAVLQYIRFVKVLGAMPKQLFLKSILIGWIFPILPVLCTSFSNPDSYTAGIQNFCYPKNDSLYFGLLLPVALIITSNVLVFVMIMTSISRSKAVQYDKSGHMLRRQTYLAILLFFMLGCPWIFGILAEMLRDVWFEIIFVYLFCLTATLQGFVLFAFYVVLDKDTRLLWTNYIKSHI